MSKIACGLFYIAEWRGHTEERGQLLKYKDSTILVNGPAIVGRQPGG